MRLSILVCLGVLGAAVAGCSSGDSSGFPDSGSAELLCLLPPDGGILARGFPAISGCAKTGQRTGVLDLEALGWTGGLMVVPDVLVPGEALPVVLVFHGAGGTPDMARADFQLDTAAAGGAIVVYLASSAFTWDIRQATPDARRVDTVLQHLADEYCIDPHRVFGAGYSAGAVFGLYLTCNVPAVFRGVASVAGTDARFDTRCCTAPQSAIFIHGSFDAAFSITEARGAMNVYLGRDGCSVAGPADAGNNCQEYRGCTSGALVDWCPWIGDHSVPSWAGEEIWRFVTELP
jgi:polyhydroxybutyrate depolymerase